MGRGDTTQPAVAFRYPARGDKYLGTRCAALTTGLMICPAEIKGSWDGWKEAVKMELHGSEWVTTVHLAPGTYYFKYIVDGRWCHLETVPHVVQDGNLNSTYSV